MPHHVIHHVADFFGAALFVERRKGSQVHVAGTNLGQRIYFAVLFFNTRPRHVTNVIFPRLSFSRAQPPHSNQEIGDAFVVLGEHIKRLLQFWELTHRLEASIDLFL